MKKTEMPDIPDEIVELACAAYRNCNLFPCQHEWDGLVEREDPRVPDLRFAMKAALSAAIAAGLATKGADSGKIGGTKTPRHSRG